MTDLELSLRGLSIIGNKNDLKERLEAVIEEELLLETDDLITSKNLSDELDILLDEQELLWDGENRMLKSKTITPTTNLAATTNKESQIETKNTTTTTTIEPSVVEAVKLIGDKSITMYSEQSAGVVDVNKVKRLTMQERLELRAKRFSLNLKTESIHNITAAKGSNNATTIETIIPDKPLNEETELSNSIRKIAKPSVINAVKLREPVVTAPMKKLVNEGIGQALSSKKLKELTMRERREYRAKRFNINLHTKSKDPLYSNEKQIEILKKRAERFNCITSTKLAKLNAEERLLKRKQRFEDNPEAESNNGSSRLAKPSASNDDEHTEPARKRFKSFQGLL